MQCNQIEVKCQLIDNLHNFICQLFIIIFADKIMLCCCNIIKLINLCWGNSQPNKQRIIIE